MKLLKLLLSVVILLFLYLFGAAQFIVSNLIAWFKAVEYIAK